MAVAEAEGCKLSRSADQSEALLCFVSALSSNGGQLSDESGSSEIGSTKSPISAHAELPSLAAAIFCEPAADAAERGLVA